MALSKLGGNPIPKYGMGHEYNEKGWCQMDPQDFELSEFIPHLVRRMSAHLSKSLAEALKPFGQTPNTWRILLHLVSHGSCTLTELCGYTLLDQSTSSRTVDKVEAEGLVRRVRQNKDGRTILIEITDHGRDVYKTIFPIAMAQGDWALSRISQDELNQFRSTLKSILDTIRISPYK